jgi:hypothetical protein
MGLRPAAKPTGRIGYRVSACETIGSRPASKVGASLSGCVFLLCGCTAEIVVIPPPRVATTSQILGPVEQSESELSRPKPKARSAAVRQTLFHLGQRASGSVRAKNRSILVRQAVPALRQKASGTIPGEFSQEYSDEYK